MPSNPYKPQRPAPALISLPANDNLKGQLLERLRCVSFHAFETCVRELLLAMGYERVDILGRVHFSGRNRDGGADIEARGRAGASPVRALVRAKQYSLPVQAKYVDELRGAMVRLQAGHGIIVSTAGFSPVAAASARASSLAPVTLIGGGELADLLVRHRVGVREGLAVTLKIDERFFDALPR